jgi:hypothetical protein
MIDQKVTKRVMHLCYLEAFVEGSLHEFLDASQCVVLVYNKYRRVRSREALEALYKRGNTVPINYFCSKN